MVELPTLTVRRNIPRPSESDLAPFARAATGHVVDALGRRGALHYLIKPVTKAIRFAGVALTVSTRSRDNLAPWMAIDYAMPGDVLVIAAGGSTEAAIVGDVLAGMARNKGVVAIVTDGLARDIDGLDSVGIPVFALGVSPNSPFKTGPGSVGLPVVVGGEPVASGDLIVGDIDGVVVVPQARLNEIADELTKIRANEAGMDERVRRGETRPAWVAAVLETVDIRFAD